MMAVHGEPANDDYFSLSEWFERLMQEHGVAVALAGCVVFWGLVSVTLWEVFK